MKLRSLRPNRRFFITIAVAAVIIAADAASKRAVQQTLDLGERRAVVDDLLVLTHVHNTGAAYGLFAGHRWLLVLTAALIAAATPLLLRALPLSGRWAWAGPALTGMIVGGAAGNLIERARGGYVTDFIQTPPIELFQVFNVSDAAISVAIVALLVLSFVVKDEPPPPAPATEVETAAPAERETPDNETPDEPQAVTAATVDSNDGADPPVEAEPGGPEPVPADNGEVNHSADSADVKAKPAPAETAASESVAEPAGPHQSGDAPVAGADRVDDRHASVAESDRAADADDDTPEARGRLIAARPEDAEDGAAHAAGKPRD
ncbi:MAG: signal peptidase II [Chloroflexi bacterium]|nr:signal peptidase II [Chloroflexota bacterium]